MKAFAPFISGLRRPLLAGTLRESGLHPLASTVKDMRKYCLRRLQSAWYIVTLAVLTSQRIMLKSRQSDSKNAMSFFMSQFLIFYV
jgi:hypothetical protein